MGDIYCGRCKEEFELKSGQSKLGKIIPDGAYFTMIEKIENGDIPNFFYLHYAKDDFQVNNLIIIPKYFFYKINYS